MKVAQVVAALVEDPSDDVGHFENIVRSRRHLRVRRLAAGTALRVRKCQPGEIRREGRRGGQCERRERRQLRQRRATVERSFALRDTRRDWRCGTVANACQARLPSPAADSVDRQFRFVSRPDVVAVVAPQRSSRGANRRRVQEATVHDATNANERTNDERRNGASRRPDRISTVTHQLPGADIMYARVGFATIDSFVQMYGQK